LVFVALGDCLAESPRIVGYGGTHQGRLFVEVFVPWGSDLTLCAASEPSPGAPSTLYGKAPGGVPAAAHGEIQWAGVEGKAAPRPPHSFPRSQPGPDSTQAAPERAQAGTNQLP